MRGKREAGQRQRKSGQLSRVLSKFCLISSDSKTRSEPKYSNHGINVFGPNLGVNVGL